MNKEQTLAAIKGRREEESDIKQQSKELQKRAAIQKCLKAQERIEEIDRKIERLVKERENLVRKHKARVDHHQLNSSD